MKRKIRAITIALCLLLLMVACFTVPSKEQYLEYLIIRFNINCDTCYITLSDPISHIIDYTPFYIKAKTYIYDDPENYVKVLGLFNNFITIENKLKFN